MPPGFSLDCKGGEGLPCHPTTYRTTVLTRPIRPAASQTYWRMFYAASSNLQGKRRESVFGNHREGSIELWRVDGPFQKSFRWGMKSHVPPRTSGDSRGLKNFIKSLRVLATAMTAGVNGSALASMSVLVAPLGKGMSLKWKGRSKSK